MLGPRSLLLLACLALGAGTTAPAQFGPTDLIIGDLNGAHYRLDRGRTLTTIPMRVSPPYTPFDFTTAPNQTDVLMGYGNFGGSNGFGALTPSGSVVFYFATPTSPVPMLDLRGDSRVMFAPVGGGSVLEIELPPNQRAVLTTITTVTNNLRAAAVDTLTGDLMAIDARANALIAITVPGGVVSTVVRGLPPVPLAPAPLAGLHFDPASQEMVASYGNSVYRLNPLTGTITTLKSGAPFSALGVGDYDLVSETFLIANAANPPAIFAFDPLSAVVTTINTLAASTRPGAIAAAGTPRLLATAPPEPGLTTTFRLRSPADATGAYIMALSFGYGPGLPLPGGRKVYLVLDDLFRLSIANTGLVSGFQGLLDANGEAQGQLNLPNIQGLRGLRFFAAAVTFVGGGVASVSETIGLTIR